MIPETSISSCAHHARACGPRIISPFCLSLVLFCLFANPAHSHPAFSARRNELAPRTLSTSKPLQRYNRLRLDFHVDEWWVSRIAMRTEHVKSGKKNFVVNNVYICIRMIGLSYLSSSKAIIRYVGVGQVFFNEFPVFDRCEEPRNKHHKETQ